MRRYKPSVTENVVKQDIFSLKGALPAQPSPGVLPLYLNNALSNSGNTIDCRRLAYYTEHSAVPHLTLSGDDQHLHEHPLRSFSTPATLIKLAETVRLLTSIMKTLDPNLGQNIGYPN
jgi:hypothetical protein